MKTVAAWRRYLRFWRANITDDVDDELRFHEDMRIEEFMARGMPEEEARRAVANRLGNVDAAKVECVELGHVRERHARNADVFDGLRDDIRYAFRSLGRSPGWTAVALLTIALGVGATTAVFSVADALLVRTLPYPDASRVFMARREFTVDGQTIPAPLPFGIVREWRDYARTIEAASPYSSAGPGRLRSGDAEVTVYAARLDSTFLGFAGAHPVLGRNFNADDLAPNGSGTLLISEQLWRRHFGSAPDVIGKIVQLEDQPKTIVGVVPASLVVPDFRSQRADVFVPVGPSSALTVLVRLKPGVSRTVATEELGAILKRTKVPDVRPVPMEMPLRLTRPQDWLAIRQPLAMLTGAVALLLLVACTNVAHLLLARGAARHREFAVRHALGAGRSRLVRQLVTESVVLAAIGGSLAAVVGWAGLRVLAALRPARVVALTYVSSDGRVLLIASALAMGCGLAIGLFAGFRTAHRDLGLSLRSGASVVLGAGRRLRSSLVIGEVALSATLLVGALLLIHAVFDLQRMHLGFDDRGLYVVSFQARQNEPLAERAAFASVVRERAAAIPGVSAVTLGSSVPGSRGFRALIAFETPEHAAAPEDATGGVAIYSIAPDYFAMMRMPLTGRSFDDGSVARHEVIVSASVARQVWPDGNAVGRRFRNAVSKSRGVIEPWQTVIGVVPDVVASVVEGAVPALYQPLATPQDGFFVSAVALLVRIDGADPATRLKQFATMIRPGQPQAEISNVRDNITASVAEPQFTMRVLAAFALLGVVLAAVGLFGVISYSVGQRTREIGVRMTLGATRSSIARLVVGDGVRMAVIGIVLGLAGAVAATRLIQNLLYGVSRFDPFSFTVGALVLLAVSVLACAVPMLRATSVDPAIAVRAD